MLNHVTLIGNLGVDPELKKIGEDNAVAKFSLATSKKQKHSSGNWQDITQWHRIVVWGKQAENCAKFLQKGSRVSVVGEIQYGSYDKEGQKIYTTDIVAHNVIFLSNTKTGEDKPASNPSLDELPF